MSTDDQDLGRRIQGEMVPKLAGQPSRDEGFANELRELSTNYVFSSLWSRPGLDRRSRSLVTLGILIGLRATDELEYHFPIALRNGLTVEELEEVVYHATGYAGFPAAHAAQLVARAVLDEGDAK